MKPIKYPVVTTLILTAALSPLAFAQSPDQPAEISAIYSCKTETNPMNRLACYDAAIDRLDIAQRKGEVITVSKSQVEEVETEAFGFNIPSLPSLGKLFGGGKTFKNTAKVKDNPLTAPVKSTKSLTALPSAASPTPTISLPKESNTKKVILTLKSTKQFGHRKTRFFFTNGQVWEQMDGTKVYVPKVRNGIANEARISKASLGSYFLRINSKGSAIRVRRAR